MQAAPIHIGTSGFSYDDWRNGVFYPPKLASNKWLEYYAGIFDTVELNVTFYRLPPVTTFKLWYSKTPARFSFAIKGSRYITHLKRLHNVTDALKLFFSHAKALEEKLRVVLWQFPESFHGNESLLQNFLKEIHAHRYVKHAFEIRHESWLTPAMVSMLSDANIAICSADWPNFHPTIPETADFVYVRRHGTDKKNRYHGAYSSSALENDVDHIRDWHQRSKEVFIYFNNDYEGHAAQNALTVKNAFHSVHYSET